MVRTKNFLSNLASWMLELSFPLTQLAENCRIAILAFHKALYDEPRDPLVIAAFSLAVSNGGSLPEAVEIARTMSQPHATTFHEILEPVTTTRSKNALINEVVDLAASVKAVLRKMTDPDYVSQAMMKFPKAPCSDLVSPQHFKHCFPLNHLKEISEQMVLHNKLWFIFLFRFLSHWRYHWGCARFLNP